MNDKKYGLVGKDSELSLRARGLLAMHYELGFVLPADEACVMLKEGRDAVRKAQAELVEGGYIIKKKWQDNSGNWRVDLHLPTPEFPGVYDDEELSPTPDLPTPGFSGVLSSCTASELLATSSLALVPNGTSSKELEILQISETESKETEEFIEMGWPGLDDEEFESKSVMRRMRIMRGEDPVTGEVVGAVGKLPEDKRAKRQEKYGAKDKGNSFTHRSNKPEEDWTTGDLVMEFSDLLDQHAPGVPGQINKVTLAKWMNQQVGQGVPRISLLRALRRFFKDPRTRRDLGVGTPLYRRFMAYYPTVHGLVTRNTEAIDQTTLDIAARSQSKFLQELGE